MEFLMIRERLWMTYLPSVQKHRHTLKIHCVSVSSASHFWDGCRHLWFLFIKRRIPAAQHRRETAGRIKKWPCKMLAGFLKHVPSLGNILTDSFKALLSRRNITISKIHKLLCHLGVYMLVGGNRHEKNKKRNAHDDRWWQVLWRKGIEGQHRGISKWGLGGLLLKNRMEAISKVKSQLSEWRK